MGSWDVLLGSEDGTFTPQFARESGLVIPSDATSLSLMDINSDHQPDLVVASNNQPLQTFINQGRGASPFGQGKG